MIRRVCSNCGLSLNDTEERCDVCGSPDYDEIDDGMNFLSDDDLIDAYLQDVFSRAETLLKSKIVCMCRRQPRHYMVWPKSTINGKSEALTRLPFCPIRVMKYARGIGATTAEVLDKLKVKNVTDIRD